MDHKPRLNDAYIVKPINILHDDVFDGTTMKVNYGARMELPHS
jgi:hypothetical protein